MAQYLIRRMIGFFVVLLGVMIVTFVLVRKLPGGPFDYVGDRQLPPQVVANIEARYHLDWPMWKQFLSYVVGDDILGEEGTSKGLIRGDFGLSLQFRQQEVADIIATTLPLSFQLGLFALFLGLIMGVPAGTLAAIKQNSIWDYFATFGAVFFLSVPNLVLAPILIWVFALRFGWLPVAGWGAQEACFGVFPCAEDININYFRFAILPALALGTASAAGIARLTRGSLLQVLREDYIRTARAKGLKENTVIWLHAMKNGIIPVVTYLGPVFAGLITGTFIVEQIFGLNGLGKHFIQSIGNRDYTLLLGVTLLYSVVLIVANLLVDISYAALDPRIRFD